MMPSGRALLMTADGDIFGALDGDRRCRSFAKVDGEVVELMKKSCLTLERYSLIWTHYFTRDALSFWAYYT